MRDKAPRSDGPASRFVARSIDLVESSRRRLPGDCILVALILVLVLPSVGTAPVDRPGTPINGVSSLIALTPDGATLLVVNPDSNSLTFVDTASNDVICELPVGADPRSVAVSPDGVKAFVANQGSDSLAVVDVPSRELAAQLSVGDRPVGAAVSPDGRFVAVAELGRDAVRLLDAVSGATTAVLPVGDRPHGLAFTPDSRRLLVTHLLSGDVSVLTIQPFRLFLPLITRGHAAGRTRVFADGPRMALVAAQTAPISTWAKVAPAPSVAANPGGTRP